MEAYIEITPASGSELHVERRHPGERDLVVEFSMCRAHGRSLVGAPPAELIGEVPAEWVVAVGDAQLADWQAIGDDPKKVEALDAALVELGRRFDRGSDTTVMDWEYLLLVARRR